MTVHARGLIVALGGFRLGPADVACAPGRVCGIVGPNGSGKTTLLRALCGLQATREGEVWIGSARVPDMEAGVRARTIAFLPQRPTVPPALLVHEVVALGRLRLSRDAAAVERALEAVGLHERRDDPGESLSAGQMHRMGMARMLAQVQASTALVALDEPTASLDPAWSASVASIARRLAAEGRAVIVATHDFAFLGSCCDDAVLVSHGRVVDAGTVDAVATPEALQHLFGCAFSRVHGIAPRAVTMPSWPGLS